MIRSLITNLTGPRSTYLRLCSFLQAPIQLTIRLLRMFMNVYVFHNVCACAWNSCMSHVWDDDIHVLLLHVHVCWGMSPNNSCLICSPESQAAYKAQRVLVRWEFILRACLWHILWIILLPISSFLRPKKGPPPPYPDLVTEFGLLHCKRLYYKCLLYSIK